MKPRRSTILNLANALAAVHCWGGSCTATPGITTRTGWQYNCHPNPLRLIQQAANALAAVLCVGVLLTASRALAAAPSAWQVTPYRVQVLVTAAPQLQLPPAVQSQLYTDLAARIDGIVGAAWETMVAPAPASLARDMTADIHRVSAEAIPAGSLEFDKVMLVAIVSDGPGFRVSARFRRPHADVQRAGGSARGSGRHVARRNDGRDFRGVCPVGADRTLGQGLGRCDAQGRGPADARSQSDFPSRGRHDAPDHAAQRSGRQTPQGPARAVDPLHGAEDRRGRSAMPGGFRVAGGIGREGRGRIEALALRIVPPHGSTTLVLQSRTAPRQPLAGYDVYSRLPSEKTATTLLGHTDRLGRLTVPPGESPIRVLLIRNGNELLARLPVMPGLEPQVVADIANDDRRLEAEGFIVGLQEELVDMVTRREVLLTRIKARLKANKVDKAVAMFDELRRMPSAKQFTMRLDNAEKALASNDPVVQKKIDALLTDTRKLFDQHLNSRGIDEAETAIQHAKEGKEAVVELPEEKEEK